MNHQPNHQPTRLVLYPHGTFVSTSSRTVLATTDESNNSHGTSRGHTGRVGVQCTTGSYDNDGLQVIFPLVIPEIFYNHMIWYDMIWYDIIYDIWHMTYDMIWYDMIWYDMIWYDMIWHMTYDIWHMTYDIWHMTYDIWHMTYDIWHDITYMIYMI